MFIKKAVFGVGVVFGAVFLLGLSGAFVRAVSASQYLGAEIHPAVQQPAPAAQATPEVPPDTEQAIRDAFQAAVEQNRTMLLGFQIYETFIDHMQYSQDGATALLWMGLRDRETGQIIETEPGLSIATRPPTAAPGSPASWSIQIQTNDPSFIQQLRELPEELISEDIVQRFLSAEAPAVQAQADQVFRGYKLPWTAGVAKRVTNSIGHVYSVAGGLTSCPTTCRFAFDFADGTMFPLLAAKGGQVKSVKWTCPNFDTGCTNYLILEDPSTNPTSYQVYYHMAQDSVPARLRQIGAVVQQGEYIGDTDDTGYSTGHHLHFHVYLTPTASNWTWGSSVDITFDDVSDNGGRPRTCAEAREYPNLGSQCQTGNAYVSGNIPANPPAGTLELPENRTTVSTRTVRVQGTARDNIEVTRIQVVANYDGTWKVIDDIAPAGNGPYGKDVDLCAANVPEGPLALTVRIYDREGSLAPGIPVRQLIKNYSCGGNVEPPPPPACTPASDQVALYADPDFRGACQLFNLNNSSGYTVDRFGVLGGDNAASVQVGSNVAAILYDRSSDVSLDRTLGRVETLYSSDAGLADNAIGIDHVSGLRVVSRSVTPGPVIINPIGSRLSGTSITSLDSLVLSWEGGWGASAYDVQLTGPGKNLSTSIAGNSLAVGNLDAGSYTLVVTAKNGSRTSSAQTTFTVYASTFASAAARSVPYQDNMESGAGAWVRTGLWRLGAVSLGGRSASNAWVFNNGTSYADGTYRAGDLTSPPVTLPAGTVQYLRFLYYMDTEDGAVHWDKRMVQVSVNGGPFEDLVQLSGDKQAIGQIWLSSGPISLQRFAGSTIRLRFHFDTIDEDRNSGKGWAIDDVSITAQAPDTSCADNNNNPASAQVVRAGDIVSGAVCPEGDVDYYRIDVPAGLPLSVDINARTLNPASKLDAFVSVIDTDGRSIIAENDDEEYAKLQDSLLSFVFQRAGTYFIKVRAWDYPGSGGAAYFYQMDLTSKAAIRPRDVRIDYPSSRLAPSVPFTIYASAVDFDDLPVKSVEFYWHGPDWSTGWVKLGADTDGSNGWSYPVTPSLYGGLKGSAVYVQAISRTGGVRGAVQWDLVPDLSVPSSRMNPLPAGVNSTAVQLSWAADDAQGDIARFEIQYQVSTGGAFSAWQNWNRTAPGYTRSIWFDGTAGASYRFRIRAVDAAGNAEAFPSSHETGTRLAASCVPDSREKGQTADELIPVSSESQVRFNLCKSAQDGSDDVDWISIYAQAGEELLLLFTPQGGGTNLAISMYSGSSQLLGTWRSLDYMDGVPIRWTAPAAGTYYIEVKPVKPGLFGTDMTYTVWYGDGTWIYLPQVKR